MLCQAMAVVLIMAANVIKGLAFNFGKCLAGVEER